jgi:histidine triad (HIT) family protein
MSKSDCVFCKVVAGQIPATRVYEDDDVLAFLDIGPISEGHTLVIPKRHYEKLEDCPAEVLKNLIAPLGKVAGAVKEAAAADGYNVLCNVGKAAGQLVGHIHFHIIPRKAGDGVFAKWPSRKYPEGGAEQIAAKIIEKL